MMGKELDKEGLGEDGEGRAHSVAECLKNSETPRSALRTKAAA